MLSTCVENFELKILSEFKKSMALEGRMGGKAGLKIAYSNQK